MIHDYRVQHSTHLRGGEGRLGAADLGEWHMKSGCSTPIEKLNKTKQYHKMPIKHLGTTK